MVKRKETCVCGVIGEKERVTLEKALEIKGSTEMLSNKNLLTKRAN